LVAVNLSDLAAKGAEPIGVLIGATLEDGADRFVAGLRVALEEYGVPLLGGDTIALPFQAPAVFGCTAIGRATTRPVPARTHARPGDTLWVTGRIGAAMMGFRAGDGEAYLRPRPRLSEGRLLAPCVSAMMDVSDGLLLDAERMALASACTIAIDFAAIPFADDVAAEDRAIAATWGDDYELLFTLASNLTPPVPATRIGAVAAAGEHPLLVDGKAMTGSLGYQHR
jgi:thiamine-monophosphate kinase